MSTILLALLVALGTGGRPEAAQAPAGVSRRWVVERSFGSGVLDACDAAAKQRIHARNAAAGVRWLHSYVTADRSRTFCIYEGPTEAAVRDAARRSELPVDRVVEVPVDLTPGPQPALPRGAVRRRFIVERTFPAGALDGLDADGKRRFNARNAALGVRWVHSYANAAKTKTFCIYEGPDEAAVRTAAERNAIPIDRVVEVPLDLSPH